MILLYKYIQDVINLRNMYNFQLNSLQANIANMEHTEYTYQ